MNATPLEQAECRTFVEYLELLQKQGKIGLFTHSSNETYTKSWKIKNRNKAMGVRAGMPDYLICLPAHKTLLFIEMKRVKGGTLTVEQKAWLKMLNECGVIALVAKGFDEANAILERYV